jgi:hypothetical protein
MTPQEKAKDLYDSYWYCLFESNIEKRNYWSKQCALIAVDEMTKYNPNIYHNDMVKEKYYNEVKQEIELL